MHYFRSIIKFMFVSKAKPTDVEALNLLINSAYRGASSRQGWTTEEGILGGIRIDETTLRTYFEHEKITILKYTENDGFISGTVYLEVRTAELYLGMFAVSPNFQGKGIGKALLVEAEKFALANNCDSIVISVISSRIELMKWYKKLGYVADGKSIAFEEIKDRFGEPKVSDIRLIGMKKNLLV